MQLSQPVKFESTEHLRKVLIEILSKAEDFIPVQHLAPECRVLVFPKGSRNKQYVDCPEQDCENLVYFYDQSQSMIEILNLHETPEWQSRVQKFHEWYFVERTNGLGRPRDDWKNWNKGSSKRSQSLLSPAEGRTHPYEDTKPWKDLGPANIEESFLYSPSDVECPVVKQHLMSKPGSRAVRDVDRDCSQAWSKEVEGWENLLSILWHE